MINRFKERFDGFTNTVLRFPLTMIFLVAWAIMNFVSLTSYDYIDYNEYAYAFLIGACSYVVLQVLYETFFKDRVTIRYAFMGLSVLFSIIYFSLVRSREPGVEFAIRTAIILFILLIAFLWIPTIKRKVSFNETFLVSFGAFFTVVLFAALLYLGIILIISTIDNLIVSVNGPYYEHVANVIILLYAPIHFLSLIPVYDEGEEKKPSKFLTNLISYVFIPISGIFTIILLLYIILNIRGDFWTDNILEPMLVSYSILVILIYILASQIDNIFSSLYRKIIPKVLIPIVLFQTISSLLKIGELGITLGRYYVIMFGVFAVIAGIIFSILPVKKNGIIAPILIGLSIISILPPVDAFTISRKSQIGRLERVLVDNEMLEGDILRADGSLLEQDKEVIRNSISYLENMDYIKDIVWLDEYYNYHNFEATFGFPRYDYVDHEKTFKSFRRSDSIIKVTGHDYIMEGSINYDNPSYEVGSFKKDNDEYYLYFSNEDGAIILYRDEIELIRFSINEIFYRFEKRDSDDYNLSNADASFSVENEEAILTIIAENVYLDMSDEYRDAYFYILIGIK